MRSAEELALAIDQGCDLDAAVPLIETDRRAAQIAVLRELRNRLAIPGGRVGGAMGLVGALIVELEKEGGE